MFIFYLKCFFLFLLNSYHLGYQVISFTLHAGKLLQATPLSVCLSSFFCLWEQDTLQIAEDRDKINNLITNADYHWLTSRFFGGYVREENLNMKNTTSVVSLVNRTVLIVHSYSCPNI